MYQISVQLTSVDGEGVVGVPDGDGEEGGGDPGQADGDLRVGDGPIA